MIIEVDTREQKPWKFTRFLHEVTLHRGKVDFGDYTIRGHERNICIERKSRMDFWSCLTGQRARFEKRMEGFQWVKHPLVVVESTYFDPPKMKVIVGTLGSWAIKYPTVKFYFFSSRSYAEQFAYKVFRRYLDEQE